MTNQQIIITIVVALISSFAKVIFEKILGPYIPERKKLNSYIKNFFSFIFLYALPIACVIWLMIRVTVVDKYFVLSIAMSFFSLTFNISNYTHRIINKVVDKQGNSMISQVGIMSDQLNLITTMNKLIGFHTEQINRIQDELRSKKNV